MAPKSDNKKRMSLRVPKGMLPQIEADLLASGYNKKERTAWFEDILKDLFEDEDHLSLIAEEFITPGTTHTISLTISLETFEKVKEAVFAVKKQEQAITDRSSVIRTAIIQRLMKGISYE